jgi:hypothetical protein
MKECNVIPIGALFEVHVPFIVFYTSNFTQAEVTCGDLFIIVSVEVAYELRLGTLYAYTVLTKYGMLRILEHDMQCVVNKGWGKLVKSCKLNLVPCSR